MITSMQFQPAMDEADLSVVVPVYRSAPCLEALVKAIAAAVGDRTYEVVLVNDYSPDRSWQVIESICETNRNVIGVDLRRNFGQDNAILTGLRLARGKYIAIMDDDLQHNPADLPALVNEIERGADVVYADFRTKHQKLWKNLGSWFNGKVAEWVIDKPKDIYLSPYKVIRKDVAQLICQYDGPAPYIDGLLFQVTSRMSHIPVEHHSRFAGASTYTFWKSVRVWGRLAFTFSVAPLRLVTWFGFTFAVLGLLLVAGVIAYRLVYPQDFSGYAVGWASLMVALLLVGGIQMIFFGILGEYAGRMFLKVSNKPQTAVRTILNGSVVQEGAALDRVNTH